MKFHDKTTESILPIVVSVALIASMSVFFSVHLGVAEPQHIDSYSTMTRSLGFLLTGDWTTVHQCGVPNFNKPPLQYMLTAGLLSTGMNPNLALRLLPFAFTVGTVALSGLLAALLVASSRWWAAMCAVVLLSSSPMLWMYGRLGYLDAGQTFFLLVALCGALLATRNPRSWMVVGIGVGLGFLQKTPIALLAVAILILTQSVWDPRGPLAWQTVRRNPSFRIAAVIAIVLCVIWPALQFAQHGSEYLERFFWQQMIERFAPENPFDAEALIASASKLTWFLRSAPQTWALCAAAVLAVLFAPRFSDATQLRGLAVLVAIAVVALALAGGAVYPRYVVVVFPLLAVIGAVVLVDWLPRGEYAAVISIGMLALSIPSLAEVPKRTSYVDRSGLIEISRGYKEHALSNESPVFVASPPDRRAFRVAAFCYHAELGRALRIDYDRLDSLSARTKKIGLVPPYSGIVHSDYFSYVENSLGAVVKVTEMGSYVVWRQPQSPAPDEQKK